MTELAAGLDESEETVALGLLSRMMQLDYAWRLGMEPSEAEALAAEATRSPTGSATCARWHC